MRAKIKGTSDRPRLCVFCSNKYIYGYIIDDSKGVTLAAARQKKIVDGARKVGKKVAEEAKEKKINRVVFDRGGYKYHGRVKALAEGARDGGLQF